jgi:hypothetical protein
MSRCVAMNFGRHDTSTRRPHLSERPMTTLVEERKPISKRSLGEGPRRARWNNSSELSFTSNEFAACTSDIALSLMARAECIYELMN